MVQGLGIFKDLMLFAPTWSAIDHRSASLAVDLCYSGRSSPVAESVIYLTPNSPPLHFSYQFTVIYGGIRLAEYHLTSIGRNDDTCTVASTWSGGVRCGDCDLPCLLMSCRLSVTIDQKEPDGDCCRPNDSGHSLKRQTSHSWRHDRGASRPSMGGGRPYLPC